MNATKLAVETVSNGIGCLYALREVFPDVLVLERDLLWGWFGRSDSSNDR